MRVFIELFDKDTKEKKVLAYERGTCSYWSADVLKSHNFGHVSHAEHQLELILKYSRHPKKVKGIVGLDDGFRELGNLSNDKSSANIEVSIVTVEGELFTEFVVNKVKTLNIRMTEYADRDATVFLEWVTPERIA